MKYLELFETRSRNLNGELDIIKAKPEVGDFVKLPWKTISVLAEIIKIGHGEKKSGSSHSHLSDCNYQVKYYFGKWMGQDRYVAYPEQFPSSNIHWVNLSKGIRRKNLLNTEEKEMMDVVINSKKFGI